MKLPGKLRMGMEIFLTVNLVTTGGMTYSQPSIMNIVCRWDAMISLLMTAGVMEYASVGVITLMVIIKEVFCQS